MKVDYVTSKSGATHLVTTILTDAEFEVQGENYPNLICNSFGTPDNEDVLLLQHPDSDINISEPQWTGDCALIDALPDLRMEKRDYVEEDYKDSDYLIIQVGFYFSGIDILSLWKDEEMRRYIQDNMVQKRRLGISRVDGKGYHSTILPVPYWSKEGNTPIAIKLLDLCAVAGNASLEKAALSYGYPGSDIKGSMDPYKHCMKLGYQREPEVFKAYARNDITLLRYIYNKHEEVKGAIWGELGMKPDGMPPYTSGALVSQVVEDYMKTYYKLPEMANAHLKQTSKRGEKGWTASDLLSAGGVFGYAGKRGAASSLLALTTGGLCQAFRPTLTNKEGFVVDIDRGSAYANVMRNIDYVIGIPETYSSYDKDPRAGTNWKLGNFMKSKKFGARFEDYKWVVIVSGPLAHRNDLVLSTDVSPSDVEKFLDGKIEDIPKKVVMEQSQLTNGIITKPIWDIWMAKASNEEKKVINDLKVVAAGWYASDNKVDSPEEFIQMVKAKPGERVRIKKDSDKATTGVWVPSKKWFSVPFEEVVGVLSDRRGVYKKERGTYVKGTPEYSKVDAIQESLKLACNSMFGAAACPHLAMSNTIFANNVTATMRANIWCTAKALNADHAITDGASFLINEVLFCESKGSLQRLFDVTHKNDVGRSNRGFSIGPLGGVDWQVISGEYVVTESGGDHCTTIKMGDEIITSKTEKWGMIDKLCDEHVANFINTDWIKWIPSAIKDVYVHATYHNQADYNFLHADGSEVVKARGWKKDKAKAPEYYQALNIPLPQSLYLEEDENGDWVNAPNRMELLLEAIRKDPTRVPSPIPQQTSGILKLKEAQRRGGWIGTSYLKNCKATPASVTIFKYLTIKQRRAWERFNSSKKYGPIERYFTNDDGTINLQELLDTCQERIDNGKNWVTDDARLGDIKKDTIDVIHEVAIDDDDTPLILESFL